jgi:hypothetical protein
LKGKTPLKSDGFIKDYGGTGVFVVVFFLFCSLGEGAGSSNG